MALPALLVGCSSHDYLPEKQAIRLPMIFQVEEFKDSRLVDNHKTLADAVDTREKYNFNEDMFLKTLVRSINHRSLYQYDPARLRIRLKDYAAVKDGNMQTVSFYADITGVNKKGEVLASGLFSCLVSDRHVLKVQDTFERVFDINDRPQQWKSQSQQMWEDLYRQCLTDMAYQFKEKVVFLHRGNS